ncbi:hypothetical protein LXA44_17900, partial [Erwinia amylovora]|nr:hypothetical protein [Erwinia amylovora]
RDAREVEEMLVYAIPLPRLGFMIEVPSMILMIDQLRQRVDFVYIGTNHLTHSLQGVDRNKTREAHQ